MSAMYNERYFIYVIPESTRLQLQLDVSDIYILIPFDPQIDPIPKNL